jgi:hypothetical protein
MNIGHLLILLEISVFLEEGKNISEESEIVSVIIRNHICQFKVRIAHAQRLIGNVMLDIRGMHILLVFQ